MINKKAPFIVSVLLFSAIIFLLGYLLFSTILKAYYLPVFYFFAPYFMLLTITDRLILMKKQPGKSGKFNIRYFLARGLKIFFHLIFVVSYILYDRENILPFILTFLACYVIYSIFDISTLSYYLKKSN